MRAASSDFTMNHGDGSLVRDVNQRSLERATRRSERPRIILPVPQMNEVGEASWGSDVSKRDERSYPQIGVRLFLTSERDKESGTSAAASRLPAT